MDGAEKGNTSASDASQAQSEMSAPGTITSSPRLTRKKLFLVVLCVNYSNRRAINRTILFLEHSYQHFSSFPWTRPSYPQRYQQLRPTLKQWRTFLGLRVLIFFLRFAFFSSVVECHLLNCTLKAAFVLFFGKVLAICAAKPVFMVSIAIFELGSLFCAVAPSVNFLIFGRAVAGVGAGGLWVSILSIMAQVILPFFVYPLILMNLFMYIQR